MAVEIELPRQSGVGRVRRVVAALGYVVNPDGVRNQIEGGAVDEVDAFLSG